MEMRTIHIYEMFNTITGDIDYVKARNRVALLRDNPDLAQMGWIIWAEIF